MAVYRRLGQNYQCSGIELATRIQTTIRILFQSNILVVEMQDLFDFLGTDKHNY